MSSFDTFIPIFKAKAPRRSWKTTRTRARLDSLSRKMANSMGVSLTNGIKKFRSSVDPAKVYDAWMRQDYSKIIDNIPWAGLYEKTDEAFDHDGKAMQGGWEISREAIPAPKDPGLRWDLSNPKIRTFIASRRALNFTSLSEDSAANIRSWTTASFERALSPRQVAEGIKGQIGLLPAHAKAVERYRGGLLAGGMHPLGANTLSNEYADRLLDYRAMMIGRTETKLATNQGQLSVWRQAADQGLVNRHTTGKRWITMGPDPCDICEPMDGKTVALDSSWTLDDGTPCDCPPDGTHPHCECSFDIVYDFDEIEED